jgi:hypothetical protein
LFEPFKISRDNPGPALEVRAGKARRAARRRPGQQMPRGKPQPQGTHFLKRQTNPGIVGGNQRADAGADDFLYAETVRHQRFENPDVGNTTRSPGSQNQTDRLFWSQWTHGAPYTTDDRRLPGKNRSGKTVPSRDGAAALLFSAVAGNA